MTCANNAPYAFSITAVKSDGVTPYDLTGATIEIQFKRNAGASDDDTPTLTTEGATPESGITVTDPPTAGLATGVIPLETMQAMPAGRWLWDCIVTPASGNTFYGGGGKLFVRQGITESDTPSLQFGPAGGSGTDGITVAEPGDGITLTLAPGGPPGTGASFAPQAAPAAPAEGFLLYCDAEDGVLKAISANGVITPVAGP